MLIRIVALVFFGGATLANAQNVARPTAAPTPSVVYTAHDAGAVHHYHTAPIIVREMVNRLVMAVTHQPDIAKAWASLVSPNDKIGIKICAAGGQLFTTHRDVVNAIVDGLAAAGHARESIIVWDRELGGIKEAGYRPGAEGYRLRSIAPREGFDPKASFTEPALGKLVWGDLDYKPIPGQAPLESDTANTSDVSHFCRILSSEVTKVINVPVMSDSEGNGLAGCLYNMTLPNIDNWRRFRDSSSFAGASIADIYANPIVSKKVVLNIMDGLIAEYAGGPQAQPNYALHHATLLASKDPVAVDTVALKQIEIWRGNAHLPPFGSETDYIKVAGQLGLGTADPKRIEIRNVERD